MHDMQVPQLVCAMLQQNFQVQKMGRHVGKWPKWSSSFWILALSQPQGQNRKMKAPLLLQTSFGELELRKSTSRNNRDDPDSTQSFWILSKRRTTVTWRSIWPVYRWQVIKAASLLQNCPSCELSAFCLSGFSEEWHAFWILLMLFVRVKTGANGNPWSKQSSFPESKRPAERMDTYRYRTKAPWSLSSNSESRRSVWGAAGSSEAVASFMTCWYHSEPNFVWCLLRFILCLRHLDLLMTKEFECGICQDCTFRPFIWSVESVAWVLRQTTEEWQVIRPKVITTSLQFHSREMYQKKQVFYGDPVEKLCILMRFNHCDVWRFVTTPWPSCTLNVSENGRLLRRWCWRKPHRGWGAVEVRQNGKFRYRKRCCFVNSYLLSPFSLNVIRRSNLTCGLRLGGYVMTFKTSVHCCKCSLFDRRAGIGFAETVQGMQKS